MTKQEKYVTGGIILAILLVGGVAAASSGDDKKDDDDDGGKKKPDCPPGYARALDGKCRWIKKDNPEFTEDDDCAEGMVVNWRYAAAKAINDPDLDSYPRCVEKECPAGFTRNRFGVCIPPEVPPPGTDDECPEGMMRGPTGLCVPITCPDAYERDPATGQCFLEPCRMGFHRDPVTLACVPNDEPIDIDDYIKDYPEGNSFYQMKQGQILGWGLSGRHDDAISQMLLARELALAAHEFGGMNMTAAIKWGRDRSKNTTLTNKIYNAILCAAINDGCYGTWGYCGDSAIANGVCPASMRNHPGEHGRAIRPLTQHADNLSRLREGLPMARTVAILTAAQKGNGKGNPVAPAQPGGDDSYPLLWMPGIDRARLFSSNGTVLEFLTEQANPPDEIMDRGITDYSGSTLSAYGCTSGSFDGRREFS